MTDQDIRAALLVAGDDEGRPRGFTLDEVVARGRRRRRTPWFVAGAAAAAVVIAGAVVGPQLADDGPDGDAGCAGVIELDGVQYSGHAELMWTSPPTTGRTEGARQPRCDDGHGGSPERTVVVEELAALPLARGFLSEGSVYLRVDAPFPERIRPWFRPKACGADAPTEVTGRWTGVTSSKKVRFDGDVRAPLRIDFVIESASPGGAEYVGWQVRIRDTGAARPALTPQDAKDALRSDAPLTVRVHCDDGRWLADGFRVQR